MLRAMSAPSSKFLDSAGMDWRPFDEAPGVSFKVLKTHKPGTGVTRRPTSMVMPSAYGPRWSPEVWPSRVKLT